MRQPALALEITPEQVSSIQTLGGKQLHITLDYIYSLHEVFEEYKELISKFLEDNMASSISIEEKTVYMSGMNTSVVIISINKTYVN